MSPQPAERVAPPFKPASGPPVKFTADRVYTREQWLTRLFAGMRQPIVDMTGLKMPDNVRVCMSLPTSRRANGQAFYEGSSGDGHIELIVSLTVDDPCEITHILAHEMLHALCPGAGHRGKFQTAARAIGLAPPWRSTTPTDAFWLWAGPILEAMPKYSGAALHAWGHRGAAASGGLIAGPGEKQTTRLLKAHCPECGCTARVTRRWAYDVACTKHGRMIVEGL